MSGPEIPKKKSKGGRKPGSPNKRKVVSKSDPQRLLELMCGDTPRDDGEREYRRLFRRLTDREKAKRWHDTTMKQMSRSEKGGFTVHLSMDGVARKIPAVKCPKCEHIFSPDSHKCVPEVSEDETEGESRKKRITAFPPGRGPAKKSPSPITEELLPSGKFYRPSPPKVPRAYRTDTWEEIQADQESQTIREKSGIKGA